MNTHRFRSLLVFSLIAGSATLLFAAATPFVGFKGGSYYIGGQTTDPIGFYGKKPIAQQAVTVPTRTAFQALGLQAADGTITATATGTGGTSTATLNTTVGTITTGAITTAAGATHVLTVTDSSVTTASVILPSLNINGSTGTPVITSIEPGSGTFVVRITNLHASAAVNAALKIGFSVAK